MNELFNPFSHLSQTKLLDLYILNDIKKNNIKIIIIIRNIIFFLYK
jgi:hypothetical protein